MKALAITIIFTIIFALGLVQDVQAQASASVSYTIVVTEDMLAGRGNDRGMDMDLIEDRERAPQTSVAVRMHDVKNANQELPAFEVDISPEDSPAIAGMLAENMQPVVSPEAETADVQTDRYQEEDGEYLVVMEFN